MSFRSPDQLLLPWSPRYSVSTQRVMDMLDVSAQTVIRLIEDGSLKAYKVRDKATSPWRINYDSVIAYIEAMHQRAGLDTRF